MVRADPFHWTVAPETNDEPSTVRVKAAPPAVAVLGEIVLITGEVDVGGVVLDLLPLPPHPSPNTRDTDKAHNDERRKRPCMTYSQG